MQTYIKNLLYEKNSRLEGAFDCVEGFAVQMVAEVFLPGLPGFMFHAGQLCVFARSNQLLAKTQRQRCTNTDRAKYI